jgi:DNA-binding beta-propeller fold protein YncE
VPNGSLGSVAFSWVLSNDTVVSGAVNQRYGLTPDQLLYVPATQELWAAFATPAPGQSFNTTVQNLSDGETDILNGPGNVTGIAYDAPLGYVFMTQIAAGGMGGQLLDFGLRSHEVGRAPTTVQPHPTGVRYDGDSGTLWVPGWTNLSSPGSVVVVTDQSGVVRTVVPVGLDPTAVAFDPGANLAFVANSGSRNLTILRESDASLVGAFSLPGNVWPGALAFDNATDSLVALLRTGSAPSTTLVSIDPTNGSVTDLGALPGNATASTLVADPTSGDVYVATEQANGSSLAGGQLLRWSFVSSTWSIAGGVGRNPDTQSFDPSGELDFVGHENQSYVSIVNVSEPPGPAQIVEFGGGPRGGAYDPSDGRVYVVNSYDGGSSGSAPDILEAIDPASGAPAVPVSPGPPGSTTLGSDPAGLVDDPSSASLIVADRGWSEGTVLSAATGSYVARLPLLFAPVAVADDPVRGLVYFASDRGEIASYYSSNHTSAGQWNVTPPTIPWNSSFEALAVDSVSGSVALVSPDLGPAGISGVWILDPQNGSSRFVALGAAGAGADGNYPTAAAFDPTDGDVYVGTSAGAVDVVDPGNATVVASGPVGTRISYLAVPGGNRSLVVAADAAAGALRVLNGSSPASLTVGVVSVLVGPDPDGVTVDPALGQVVVSDYGSATLDAFSPVPEVGSLTVHVTIPTVGALPQVTAVDDVGRPVLLVALAGGGSGPLSFAYAGLPAGCPTSNTSMLFCVPTGPGTVDPTVTIVDPSGETAEAGTQLTVEPAPTLSATAAPDPVDDDRANVTIVTVVAGGVGPFVYAVGFGDGTASVNGTASGDGFVVVHEYSGPGRFTATISVTDQFQATASTAVPVVLGPPMTGSASVVAPSTGSPPLNVSFEAQVSGGVAPYTFTWHFSVGSQTASSAANRSTVTETFAQPGPEEAEVWVNDSSHASVVLFVNTTVPAPPPHHAAASLPWLDLAAVAGAAAVVVAAVVLVRRRRAKGGPPA